jgi:predicted phage terminase large subunit-like protein
VSSTTYHLNSSGLYLPLSTLSREQRTELRKHLTERLTEADRFDWRKHARANQLPPAGSWRVWLCLAGRGWGKTRTGAEWVREQVQSGHRRIALVAPTAADARDVMVEGESGILAIHPDSERPLYEPSKRRLTWPNGAIATTYSADEPDRLRGPQHDAAWADEIAAWEYPEAWDMLMFGLRLGKDPRVVATTTPKPKAWLRDLIRSPTTAISTGPTRDNEQNLAPAFIQQILEKYKGTRLGRQEIEGEYLEDVPGALWSRQQIDETRRRDHPDLRRIVVAIDPAATSTEGADESGIVVAGLGVDGRGYVLDDLSVRATPDGVVQRAVGAYWKRLADRIVAEANNGGEWIESVVRKVDHTVSYKSVRASRGKRTRAEPISALYEQGRISHVGSFPKLEDQMVTFTPDTDESPDRVDALVWALTELMVTGSGEPGIRSLG